MGLAKKLISPFEISLLEYCSSNSPYVIEAQTPLIEFIENRTEDAFDLAVIRASEKEYLLNIWCGENIFGYVPEGSTSQTRLVEHDTKVFLPIIKLFIQGRRPPLTNT